MRITKLHYVFSFIFILFIALSVPGYAQKKDRIQKGLATWYGTKYHGKKTTSGEVYNKNNMTAAHPSLPFGTKVKVTNPLTRKSVIVRINDRGPFGNKSRIIDLSEAAARKIKVHQHGEAQVTVEVLTASFLMEEDKDNLLAQVPVIAPDYNSIISPSPYFIIQAGVFFQQAEAVMQSEKVKSLDQDLAINLKEESISGNKIHRVEAGQFSTRAEAEAFNSRLTKRGIFGLVKKTSDAS